jgi:predicted AAA+ superfamily ATPase
MKEVVKRIISDFHRNGVPSSKERDLHVPLDMQKIVTIIGPRRAGKTFFLYNQMARLLLQGVSLQRILYINFEDERFDFGPANYDSILEAYYELYPNTKGSDIYVFFDEVQELPDWEKYVRRISDTVTSHIFLTGSNSRMLSKEIATSLRGRSLSFELMPLSFSEFMRFKGFATASRFSTKGAAEFEHTFEEYLLWGGYPELVNTPSEFKANVLQEYYNVMIYHDLLERYGISNLPLLKYVLKRLVSSLTEEFSVNKIYKELKSMGLSVGNNTVYELVGMIFSVYMMESVEKYAPSTVNREMSNKKVYMYDNGLASATRYGVFSDRGKLLENLVFTHLRRLYKDVTFLKNGFECDFYAFSSGRKPLAVQVTDVLSRDNIKRELKGLEGATKVNKVCDRLLLYGSIEAGLVLPETNCAKVAEWLLESGIS